MSVRRTRRCLSNVKLRDAVAADIAEIRRLSLEAGVAVWSADRLSRSLAEPAERLRVAEAAGHPGLAGFCLSRTVVGEEIEILNIVVDRRRRREGIGHGLLTDCLEAARNEGVRTCLLEVRESNEAAIGLYRRSGFCVSYRRRMYYQDPTEDAVVMTRRLMDEPETRATGSA